MPTGEDTMNFEGLLLGGPDDVVAALERRAQTRTADHHPWDWLPRFYAAHADGRPWVDQALLQIYDSRLTDGEPRPGKHLGEVITTARMCDRTPLLSPLRRHLKGDMAGWTDSDVDQLLSWIIAMRPSSLAQPEIHALGVRGQAPFVFANALHLLAITAPESALALIKAAGVQAVAEAPKRLTVLRTLSFFYWMDSAAHYRKDIAMALTNLPPSVKANLIDQVLERFNRTRGKDVAAQIGEALARWLAGSA
jgi:hypothetical protein